MQKLEAPYSTQFDACFVRQRGIGQKLDMVPVECVVVNYAAGKPGKRLGIEEGTALVRRPSNSYEDDAQRRPLHQCLARWSPSLGDCRTADRMQELTLMVTPF